MKSKLFLFSLLAAGTAFLLRADYQSVYEGGQSSRYVRSNNQTRNQSTRGRSGFRSDTTSNARQNRSVGQRADWNKRSLGQQVNR